MLLIVLTKKETLHLALSTVLLNQLNRPVEGVHLVSHALPVLQTKCIFLFSVSHTFISPAYGICELCPMHAI